MRRQCGRPGCSALATATFSFDAARCIVWIDALVDGSARAGDLCTRHADSLAPPGGWERVDRRPHHDAPTETAAPASAPTAGPITVTPLTKKSGARRARGTDDLIPARSRSGRRRRWSDVQPLFVSGAVPSMSGPAGSADLDEQPAPVPEPVAPAPEPIPEPVPGPAPVSWLPRNASGDDLEGVLDASTPLLARAFRNAKPATNAADGADCADGGAE